MRFLAALLLLPAGSQEIVPPRPKGMATVRETIRTLTFSGDGRWIIAGGMKQVYAVDLERTVLRHVLTGHTELVTSVAASSNGRWAASGSGDRTARIWDLETGKEIEKADITLTTTVRAVAFSPDVTLLAVGCDDRTVRLYDTAKWKEVRQLQGLTQAAYALTFSPDGKILATGGFDRVRLWNPATGKQIRELGGHRVDSDPKDGWREIQGLAFSPDGKMIASGSTDNRVRIWPVSGGKELRSCETKGSMWSVAWSGTDVLAAAGADFHVYFWDAKTGKERARVPALKNVYHWPVAISPDGKLVATGQADPGLQGGGGFITTWDLETLVGK